MKNDQLQNNTINKEPDVFRRVFRRVKFKPRRRSNELGGGESESFRAEETACVVCAVRKGSVH